jgi:signal transduction histidine kinase
MTMSDDLLEKNRSPHLRILLDILLIAVLAVIVYIAAYFLNMTGALLSLLETSGAPHASAVIFVAIFLILGLVYFVIRRWHELTQMSEEVETAQKTVDRTNAKLMLINNITRYDMLNELTQLHKDLEKTGTSPEVARVEEAINRIRRQIKFTKEYQDIGATPPAWQNAADAIMRAKVGIDLGNVSFEMDIHDVEIYADPLLEKVFYYLISNSLKYGGSNLSAIRIYRKKEEGRLIIVCEDNGVGIAKELKGGLFPKEWGSRKHAGYGLFLIRETLAVTGITIWESGNPGEGARFEISVPKGVFRNT